MGLLYSSQPTYIHFVAKQYSLTYLILTCYLMIQVLLSISPIQGKKQKLRKAKYLHLSQEVKESIMKPNQVCLTPSTKMRNNLPKEVTELRTEKNQNQIPVIFNHHAVLTPDSKLLQREKYRGSSGTWVRSVCVMLWSSKKQKGADTHRDKDNEPTFSQDNYSLSS